MIHRLLICSVLFFSLASLQPAAADDWLRFLGPNGTGIAAGAAVPNEWSPTTNMKWTTQLPGFGSSSPIILGDQVFVTCYAGYGLDPKAPGNIQDLHRLLICISKESGKTVWSTSIPSAHDEDVYEGFITEHGYASSTPTTDGEKIYCFFGKTGVVAFDLDGRQLWTTNVGTFSDPFKWGDGSSPIVYGDLVIINAGIVGHQFVALNKETGEKVWSVEDEAFTNSWSTPVLIEVNGQPELVCSVPEKIFALNPTSGEMLWTARSPVTNTVCPSLAHADGVVFAMGGRGGQAVAIRCGGRGDVTESHTLWTANMRAGICTPVVAAGKLYWSSTGILNCFSCEDGSEVYRERVANEASGEQPRRPAGDYASAVVAGDQLIIVARSGQTIVVRAGDSYQLLGTGNFGDDPGPFNATPAISDGQLFVRSNRALYCIGN